jgi:hypothetical protein
MLHCYLAKLIAECRSVTVSTEYAYKTGQLKPSKPAAKPFRLQWHRMVLTPEWKG